MSVQSLIDSILAKLVESKEHAYDVCRGICETCDEDRNNPNVRTTIEIEEPGELIKLTIPQVMSTWGYGNAQRMFLKFSDNNKYGVNGVVYECIVVVYGGQSDHFYCEFKHQSTDTIYHFDDMKFRGHCVPTNVFKESDTITMVWLRKI